MGATARLLDTQITLQNGKPEIGADKPQPLSASYHVFSNIEETSMDIGDFYSLAFCNSFNCFA
jgi:hypothetical protein